MWTGPLLLLSLVAATLAAPVAQGPAPETCPTWQACRDAVESALTADESLPRALDLAWRAVQLGPRDDAGLMFLLARAQARAGRPQDALVMVRRLAERGVVTDAQTHPDLSRVRDLTAWPDVEAMVARVSAGEPAVEVTPPAPVVAPPAPTREAPAPVTAAPIPAAAAPSAAPPARTEAAATRAEVVAEAWRFAADPFVPAGLAYDAVSRRFVIGDLRGRKLRVAGEGLDHAVDLVRAESAGFLDVRALAIDTRRGDLWVATADVDGRAVLHRIQLISGRPLHALPLGDVGDPVDPVDLAVGGNGTVWVLGRAGALLRVRPGAASAEALARLPAGTSATSLAVAPSDATAWVSHVDGLVRVDLRKGTSAEVTSAAALPLKGIERVRASRGGVVALQRGPDTGRHLVRLELGRNGQSVRAATIYDVRVPDGGDPPALAVLGDEIYFVDGAEAPGADPTTAPIGSPTDLVVRRIRVP